MNTDHQIEHRTVSGYGYVVTDRELAAIREMQGQGFSLLGSSTSACIEDGFTEILMTFQKEVPAPKEPVEADFAIPEESCYCAAVAPMAPCGWCTDPDNNPDKEDSL